jgi:hypothetical protein
LLLIIYITGIDYSREIKMPRNFSDEQNGGSCGSPAAAGAEVVLKSIECPPGASDFSGIFIFAAAVSELNAVRT